MRLVRLCTAVLVLGVAGTAVAQTPADPAEPPDREPEETSEAEPRAPEPADRSADDALGDDALDDDVFDDDVFGDGPLSDTAEGEIELGDMSVFGREADVARVTGSAHRIGEQELARREDDDIHATLAQVPGVYVRGEDGYGLRPNIGMRGANSDRSKKVTLMEDGVLSGPAPYSAPAAYYFPMVTRMVGVEVFKGPAAIQHGPHTIGGALNLLTRRVPIDGQEFGADVAVGSELYSKTHLHYGYGYEHGGWLLEAVRVRTSGFKELDPAQGASPRPDTGFQKTELTAKGRLNSDPDAELYHELGLKLGFSHELSNETYLGLTDDDFRSNAVRRYLASQLDRMENHRWLAELSYLLQYGENLSVRTTAYRHDFHRDWFKLNGFDGGVSIPDVLANPTGGTRQVLYRVLTGVEDTSGGGSGLLVGSNDRIFVAQGVQSVGNWKLPDLGPVSQRLRFGARYHYDRIVREHSQAGYAMRSGRLIDEGGPLEVTTHNRGAARAFSAHLIDEIELWDLVLSPGVRFEVIETEFENFQTGERIEGNQRALLPGVGALYDLIDVKDGARVGLLAGVHHGFSPVSPGPSVTVEPEQSVGYEGGARLAWGAARAEAIGFYNDYSNLTAECTFSKGCPEQQLGEQINAGRVSLWGLETALSHEIATPVDLVLPVRAAYTYTGSRFGNSFVSDNPQFGAVQRGDELPYVPEHQGSVSAGAVFPTFGVNLTGRAMSAMRESAGQGEASPSELTDAHVVFGALLWFSPVDWAQIYLKADNLFNEQYIVSRRPFGARPGRPRFVALGLRSEL